MVQQPQRHNHEKILQQREKFDTSDLMLWIPFDYLILNGPV